MLYHILSEIDVTKSLTKYYLILSLMSRLHYIKWQKFQVDILCATPGRLMDMVDACKVSLEFIRHLAIDEADRMLTLGFASQVRNIEQRMPPKENRQTVLFSATMPEQIEQLAADFMKEFVSLKIGSPDSQKAPIMQIVKWVEEPRKRECLMQDIAGVEGKIIGILY